MVITELTLLQLMPLADNCLQCLDPLLQASDDLLLEVLEPHVELLEDGRNVLGLLF
eukprot:CAMPEP_0115529154 /NCGR_PEP_ID=MMETSP0271-20121206/83779_1 /TAXON_ID=71861 /ORGANISM="Scrippsiella trochoidea, Strain CCMP3099" /LENGTH=55 /DNA_ID=CAMNT_0002961135 /DNA_START=148 /DNA_END=312 /DNA_ORIENTATION=-